VFDLDQGMIQFGITGSKSDWKKRFYILHCSSTQVRNTLKWSKAKMKEIKLSFQRHLQLYDRNLFVPYRKQKLQIGPIYPFSPNYIYIKNFFSELSYCEHMINVDT
jgi:hypothetical protein